MAETKVGKIEQLTVGPDGWAGIDWGKRQPFTVLASTSKPWNEEHWPVIAYVREEVTRQGHNVTTLDGIERVAWMLDGWAYALKHESRPTVIDALAIGGLVERFKNAGGARMCGVRVGSRTCPPFDRVPHLLDQLWTQRDSLTPLEFYKHFEEIHPFVDGNGRTGKILLNWLNGSLSAPVFPPSDLWGREIRNP